MNMKRNRILCAAAMVGVLSAVPFSAQADGHDPYPPPPPKVIPATGSETGGFLQVGALLVGAGAIAVVASRRRLSAN
jgi:LPXTG-motif cell wall-anchored protein